MALNKLTKVQTLGIGSNIEVVGVITTGQFKSGTSNLHASGVELTNLNVSGIATIGGNVSIGGTLTYQDVTNIDSVGIVTARQGIHIDDSIVHIGDTNTKIRFPANDEISLETSGHDRIYIKSNGSVGIGTDTPIGGLHLNSNGNNGISFRMENYEGYSSFHNDGGALHLDSGQHIFRNQAGSTEFVRITSAGNVGINQSSPRTTLDVTGYVYLGNGGQIQITGSAGAKGLQLAGADDGANIIGTMGSSGEHLVFRTASNERMRLLVGGPHLLLGGTSSVNEITESSAHAGMVIGGTGFGNAGLAIISSTSGTGRLYFGDSVGGNAARNRGQINYYHNGDYMLFATAGSERLRITSAGTVNIGNNYGQTSRLFTAENTLADGGEIAYIGNNDGGSNYGGLIISAGEIDRECRLESAWGNSFMTFYTNSGSTTEKMRLTSSGQLFLGETSAVDSNTAIQFRKDVVGNQARFIFRNRGNNNNSRVQIQAMTLNRAANADVFSGIEKYQSGGMAIYNGENTNQYSNINFFTNGWRSLQLRNGNHSGAWCAEIDAYWGTSNGLRMEVGGPQSGTWQAIDFHTSHTGTQRGYIGVTYGGVSYNSSSDYRMKQDVVDLTGAIDRVKSFKPKRFRWKEDLTHTVDGFLAHEAQTVVPESVQGEKDGEQMQVMDNSKLVPVLTAALKEAITKIETLETKVAALEGS